MTRLLISYKDPVNKNNLQQCPKGEINQTLAIDQNLKSNQTSTSDGNIYSTNL